MIFVYTLSTFFGIRVCVFATRQCYKIHKKKIEAKHNIACVHSSSVIQSGCISSISYIDASFSTFNGWLGIVTLRRWKSQKNFPRWYMAVKVDWNLLHSCRWWFHWQLGCKKLSIFSIRKCDEEYQTYTNTYM